MAVIPFMYMLKRIQIAISTLALIGLVTVSLPVQTSAQVSFTPQTERERQAYLYGQLIYLQQLRNALLELQELKSRPSAGSTSGSGFSPYATIRTVDVDEVNATTFKLQGEVLLTGTKPVQAWFEYGKRQDFLSDKSYRGTVSSAFDRAFTQSVYNLDDDERYYFRIVIEDQEKNVVYGNIRSFETDEVINSNEYSLNVSLTSILEDESVEVDWKVPRDKRNSDNWIGLFEVGDADDEYVSRRFLDDDEEGTERFRIQDAGTYEFRLFLDDSFRDVKTSSRVFVR